MRKRHIVTMADGIGSDAALEVVSAKSSIVKDAVMAFETDDYEDGSDVLVFEDLGICLKTMSEDEASTLRANESVLAVEEDSEVFVLNSQGVGDNEDDSGEACGGASDFELGYYQALLDLGMLPTELDPDIVRHIGSARLMQPPRQPCLPETRQLRAPYFPALTRSSLWPPISRRMQLRQVVPWNITMIHADKVWTRTTGRGISVAILDTGIDEDHPDLIVHGGTSLVPNVSSWDDDHGHGTHCAGIVAARNDGKGVVGVAPDADLYAVKVLDSGGSGRRSWVIAGMDWCRRNGIRVASLSLGGNVGTPNEPYSVAYQKAAERLEAGGCFVVAAAGNAGQFNNHWVGNPARCPGFMAVAAVDRSRQKAPFSSWGPPSLGSFEGIEIAAPGKDIRSTIPNGGYAAKSGTSMACPHVAGAVALLVQMRPTWTPTRIRAHLKATSRDLGVPGNDPQFGSGLLDCLGAIS